MINKFSLALSITTMCVNVSPTPAFSANGIVIGDHPDKNRTLLVRSTLRERTLADFERLRVAQQNPGSITAPSPTVSSAPTFLVRSTLRERTLAEFEKLRVAQQNTGSITAPSPTVSSAPTFLVRSTLRERTLADFERLRVAQQNTGSITPPSPTVSSAPTFLVRSTLRERTLADFERLRVAQQNPGSITTPSPTVSSAPTFLVRSTLRERTLADFERLRVAQQSPSSVVVASQQQAPVTVTTQPLLTSQNTLLPERLEIKSIALLAHQSIPLGQAIEEALPLLPPVGVAQTVEVSTHQPSRVVPETKSVFFSSHQYNDSGQATKSVEFPLSHSAEKTKKAFSSPIMIQGKPVGGSIGGSQTMEELNNKLPSSAQSIRLKGKIMEPPKLRESFLSKGVSFQFLVSQLDTILENPTKLTRLTGLLIKTSKEIKSALGINNPASQVDIIEELTDLRSIVISRMEQKIEEGSHLASRIKVMQDALVTSIHWTE